MHTLFLATPHRSRVLPLIHMDLAHTPRGPWLRIVVAALGITTCVHEYVRVVGVAQTQSCVRTNIEIISISLRTKQHKQYDTYFVS